MKSKNNVKVKWYDKPMGLKETMLLVAIIAIFFLIASRNYDNDTQELIEVGIVTRGRIYELKKKRGKGKKYTIGRYEFRDTENWKRKGTINFGEVLDKYKSELYLKDKYFPVIYSEPNPEINRMLFMEIDYDRLGLEFPDSLKFYIEALGLEKRKTIRDIFFKSNQAN